MDTLYGDRDKRNNKQNQKNKEENGEDSIRRNAYAGARVEGGSVCRLTNER